MWFGVLETLIGLSNVLRHLLTAYICACGPQDLPASVELCHIRQAVFHNDAATAYLLLFTGR